MKPSPTASKSLATRQFCVSADIDVSAQTLFKTLTTAEGMQQWVPQCRSVTYEGGSADGVVAAGMIRFIRLNSGLTAVERIESCEAPRRVVYELVSAGVRLDRFVKNYRGVMMVFPAGDGRSRLEWSVHFDCVGAMKILLPGFRVSLQALITHMTNNVCRVTGGRLI